MVSKSGAKKAMIREACSGIAREESFFEKPDIVIVDDEAIKLSNSGFMRMKY